MQHHQPTCVVNTRTGYEAGNIKYVWGFLRKVLFDTDLGSLLCIFIVFLEPFHDFANAKSCRAASFSH